MNILFVILCAFIGIILGYKVMDISHKIVIYKKSEDKASKRAEFLDSQMYRAILCLICGSAWTICALRMDNYIVSIVIGILITVGIIIAYIDIKIRIIPNELVLIMIIVGIMFQILYYGPKALIGAIISMVVMMAVFTSVAGFIGFGKVGAGDVKLAGAMGLALGYPLIITAVLIMSVVLLIFILVGMALKKIYLSTMLPMAPFMLSGFIVGLMTLMLNV